MNTWQGLRRNPSGGDGRCLGHRSRGDVLTRALLALALLVGAAVVGPKLLELPTDPSTAVPSAGTAPDLTSPKSRALQPSEGAGHGSLPHTAGRSATPGSAPGRIRAHNGVLAGIPATQTGRAPRDAVVAATERPAREPSPQEGATPPDPTLPVAEPSLGGRVLDVDGNPLVAIPVRARGERIAAALVDTLLPAEESVYTGADGTYTFSGLANGRYRVSAEATGYQRAEITASTGSFNADLTLHWEQKVVVYGRVTDGWGQPLAGARVTPNLSPAISVPTDREGLYEVTASLRENAESFDVRFEHDEHQPQVWRLDGAVWGTAGAVALDVALAPIAETTTVSGEMRSTTGEPVGGETLILYTPSLMRRFEAVSGPDGGFRIADVAVAPDYTVAVRPRGPYEDFTRRGVRIAAATDLWVPLEPMESGDLVGRMSDVWGNPIPNLTLMLNSTSAVWRSMAVTGDEQGEFAVTDVPLGGLVFQTYGTPFFRITAAMQGHTPEEVPLVLDLGPYEVHGRVLDETGLAFAAPEVYLTWSHTQGGVRSTAMRRTSADADGYFRFVRLGAGLHRITVNVPGYRAGQVDQNVGNRTAEIVLQLEPETL